MKPPLTPEQLEALRQLDTCTVANAIEDFRVRLRNEGFAAGCLRCRFPQLQTMVGYAVTLKIRGASPPIGGTATYIESTDWWDYVLSLPAPRVLVVEDVSSAPGRGALLGEVHINLLRAMGCVGAVTNGAVRDLPAVEELGFHLFSCNLSVSHSYVHIVETGTPVQIDGLTIQSGDLLHGDLHGIQSIPHEIAARLPAAAAVVTARERALIARIRAPGATLENLRAAVRGPQAN
jgi:regulator of RNase E activity RraA